MKKLSSILIILLVFSLSACSESDMISPADLNERENAIISTISDESFVFDYKTESEFKEVVVWIEKYESGKLVDDKINYMTTQIGEDGGTIILAKSKTGEKEIEQNYYIGVGDNGGLASSVAFDKKLDDKEYLSIVSGQLANEKTLNDGEENVLATIAYSNNDFGITSISNDFYEEPQAHMDELNEYNVTYLFKAEFKK